MTTIEEAHEAVRTLLGYIEGDEAVDREGLKDTPHRVVVVVRNLCRLQHGCV